MGTKGGRGDHQAQDANASRGDRSTSVWWVFTASGEMGDGCVYADHGTAVSNSFKYLPQSVLAGFAGR